MLQITRNRKWTQPHTVLDSADGDHTDLSQFDEIRCQIREKVATKVDSYFKHAIVATPDVAIGGVDNQVLTLSLSRAATRLLQVGDYLIDVVGIKDGEDESLLDPEAVRVVNRPTLPVDTDDLPDFSAIFLSQLQ